MKVGKESVLVVDDEDATRLKVAGRLERAGYDVFEASNGLEGLQGFYRNRPNLVVLDVAMPEMDGWQVLQRIREVSTIPVLMLTAIKQERDKIRGLDEGADDYITKPFSGEDLVARVKAIMRRANQAQDEIEENIYSDSDLSIDFQRHEVFVRGESVNLSATEFRLLNVLTKYAGQVLSQARLLDLVWGQEFDDSLSVARLYIAYLRQKIEENPRKPKLIEPIRGFGYRYRGRSGVSK
ncbi:MAG: response regulator transcription factor [Chloroflexi bacterium]|nr:response regulator transcription factor [Chloroflexota bacterium]